MTTLPEIVYSETTGGVKPGFKYDEFNNQDMPQLFLDARIVTEKKEEEESPAEKKLETKTEMIEKDTTDTSKEIVIPIIKTVPRAFVPIEDLVEEATKKRENKIIALLIRPETLEIIEELFSAEKKEIYQACYSKLVPSKRHLHTLADLINENLLTIDKNEFCLTDLYERFMNNLVEDKL